MVLSGYMNIRAFFLMAVVSVGVLVGQVTQAAVLVFAPDRSTIVASSLSVPADGFHTITVTVAVLSTSSTAMANLPVTLNVDVPGVSVTPTVATSNSSGRASFTLMSTAQVDLNLQALVNGVAILATKNVSFTLPQVVSPILSSMVVSASGALSDGFETVGVVVTAMDPSGNRIKGVPVSLAFSPAGASVAPAQLLTNASGTASFKLTSLVESDTLLRATVGGTVLEQIEHLVFTAPEPVSDTLSEMTTAQTSVVANGMDAATVRVVARDAAGRSLANRKVRLFSDTGSAVITPALRTTGKDGVVTFAVSSFFSGVTYVRAFIDSEPLIRELKLTFTAAPVIKMPVIDPAKVSVSLSTATIAPSVLPADAMSTSTITVKVLNGKSEPLAGRTVWVVASDPAAASVVPDSIATDSQGLARFAVTSMVAGPVMFEVTVDGVRLQKRPYVTGVAVGTCVMVHNHLFKLENDPPVYYIGRDCRRHPFPDEAVYHSWYEDFSQVQTVAPSFLASFVLGKTVAFRPGSLVRFEGSPKVYAVAADFSLRWISSEEIATALYGTAWSQQISVIQDALFLNYSFGNSIAKATDFSPSAVQAAAVTLD